MLRKRVFWLLYCLLLALVVLLRMLFRWPFSVWSAALALLALESAAFFLTDGFGLGRYRYASGGVHALFNGRIALTAQDHDLSLVLSSADIDLSAPMPKVASVRCAFSAVTIRIPEGWAVRTVCRSALSSVSTPAGNLRGLEERVLVIGDGLQAQMEVRCFFSEVRILD